MYNLVSATYCNIFLDATVDVFLELFVCMHYSLLT